jgi:hypothetical protein
MRSVHVCSPAGEHHWSKQRATPKTHNMSATHEGQNKEYVSNKSSKWVNDLINYLNILTYEMMCGSFTKVYYLMMAKVGWNMSQDFFNLLTWKH